MWHSFFSTNSRQFPKILNHGLKLVVLCFSKNSGCSRLEVSRNEFQAFQVFMSDKYLNVHRNFSKPLLHHNPLLSCPSVCSLCSKRSHFAKAQLPGRASRRLIAQHGGGVVSHISVKWWHTQNTEPYGWTMTKWIMIQECLRRWSLSVIKLTTSAVLHEGQHYKLLAATLQAQGVTIW